VQSMAFRRTVDDLLRFRAENPWRAVRGGCRSEGRSFGRVHG
jgi:hypothetical protein